MIQEFSGPFPVEVITRMAGVPEDYRQQVRHWIDTSLTREPGNIGYTEAGMQAAIDSGMYYYKLAQERRANPQDDMISRLIAAEIVGEDGKLRKLDDIEIAGFTSLLGGAGAETVTKLVGSAVVTFAKNPDQWQKLLDDRSKVPAAVEEMLRFDGPVALQRAVHLERRTAARHHDPRRQAGVPDEGGRQPGSPGIHRRTRSTSTATAPKRRTSASATAFTAASGLPWHGSKRHRGGTTVGLHAALRGQVGRTGKGPHAECRGIPPRPGEGAAVTGKIVVDFGLCESNGICMGIIPEVFDLDDEDYLHVLSDEVTPENEQQIREAVRQCPRQAISIDESS